MLLQVHIKSLSFLIAKMTLTIFVREANKKVYVSLQLLFFTSLTHLTCLDQINAGRDETSWPNEMEKHSADSGQKKKTKKLFLILDIHCPTDIKASELSEVLCLGILEGLWDRFYEQTAVTFTAYHSEYSRGKKQFSQWTY